MTERYRMEDNSGRATGRWRSRMWLLIFLSVLVVFPVLGTGLATVLDPGYSHPAGYGWWHTKADAIVDSYDRPIRVAGVDWFGMDTTQWVPAGLDYRPYKGIMRTVKRLGFNTIRLSISNQMVETNPVVTGHVAKNPELKGKHALAVLDDICRFAGHVGLKIILDDQRSAAVPANNVRLREPLWYTSRFSEADWIGDWVKLARRYMDNDAVVGFDLRDEPHTSGPGPWSLKAYLHQGATWGPYKGSDNAATDWRLAAERAGNAILKVNPHLLMFVEGVQLYPDPKRASGVDAYWWGSILRPVRRYPIQFHVPHQLVYAPHEYGPDKVDFPWFKHMTYASITRVWKHNWAFILHDEKVQAPIVLDEVGTCTSSLTCVTKREPGNQATWLHILIRYLKSNPHVGFSVWALNGTTSLDSPNGNGVLDDTWNKVRDPQLERLWQSVQAKSQKTTPAM